jgi:glucose-1-phosphate thymidylyltransferase
MKLKAIIAAGGKGTRLRPLTFTANKHLLPIANKPLLFYPIEHLVAIGIKDVGIIVNETRQAIENEIGDGSKWGLNISYINQPEPLGVGHVVKISEKFLGKTPFVYILGDNIFTEGIHTPFNHFVKSKPDALLTMVEHEENFRLGVPFFEDGKLVKVVEKPKKPPNKYGVPGLYFFNHHVFKAFTGKDAIKPSARGEYEITDLYNYLIDHGYRVETKEIKGEWLDPGKFDDSLDANRLMLERNCKSNIKGSVDKDSKLMGRVELGADSEITNSQIVGPVSIGANAHIHDSYIGPYTSIGDRCKISNSALEYSIIMEGADIIDTPNRIEASMIGKDATVHGTRSANPAYKLTVSDMSKIELPL